MTNYILAIESSCDDTSVAIIKNGEVVSNVTATQVVHKEYGGVIPELASRNHQINIIPVVEQALSQAKIELSDLDAIAFTKGPGLLGSLIVGVAFAKSLAMSLDIPMIDIHHMQAHVLAHFAEDPKPSFPFLCLTVSGGHTQIILVSDYLEMEVIGTTLDDAAGEAFDKAGKMLGLEYPGGPLVDKYAREGEAVYDFPEPKIDGLDFSFSGLKTSFMYFLRRNHKEDSDFIAKNLNNICASIQDRIVTILMNKLVKASKQYGIKEIAISGGVSANSGLRDLLIATGKDNGWNTYIPAFEYCTDNAGMIAVTAYQKYKKGLFAEHDVVPMARMEM